MKSKTMPNHHGHHRSSHHSRSRGHHSSALYQSVSNRSRNSTSNNGINGASSSAAAGGAARSATNQASESRDSIANGWSEHRSSSGKVYYYNIKTGVSQWEPPIELRQQRPASSESELSESSSIRQQQDKSPSLGASPHNSAQSESVPEDKPLLTPGLAQYFRPELNADFTSSHIEELEHQANKCSHDTLAQNARILEESVELKIAKSIVRCVDISLEALERKTSVLRQAIRDYGFV